MNDLELDRWLSELSVLYSDNYGFSLRCRALQNRFRRGVRPIPQVRAAVLVRAVRGGGLQMDEKKTMQRAAPMQNRVSI